jgi:hypothetical protein
MEEIGDFVHSWNEVLKEDREMETILGFLGTGPNDLICRVRDDNELGIYLYCLHYCKLKDLYLGI